jgi:hypothetical protein
VVYEDNTSTITLATSKGTPHKKSKHFGVEWAYLKEAVEMGELKIYHVNTNLQLADILTKSIMTPKFPELRDKVMGGNDKQGYFNKVLLVTHSLVKQ